MYCIYTRAQPPDKLIYLHKFEAPDSLPFQKDSLVCTSLFIVEVVRVKLVLECTLIYIYIYSRSKKKNSKTTLIITRHNHIDINLVIKIPSPSFHVHLHLSNNQFVLSIQICSPIPLRDNIGPTI